MSTLTTFSQHSFESPKCSNQRRKRSKKKVQIGKEVKLSLLADDMILYIKDPKDTTRKPPELINEFGKVAGYKINTQKSVAFLYTNNERSKKRNPRSNSFTIASKE